MTGQPAWLRSAAPDLMTALTVARLCATSCSALPLLLRLLLAGSRASADDAAVDQGCCCEVSRSM